MMRRAPVIAATPLAAHARSVCLLGGDQTGRGALCTSGESDESCKKIVFLISFVICYAITPFIYTSIYCRPISSTPWTQSLAYCQSSCTCLECKWCWSDYKVFPITGLKSKSSLESLLSKSMSSLKSSLIMSKSSNYASHLIRDSSPSQVSSHVTQVYTPVRKQK